MAIAPERPHIYEGTRIPSPIPTVLQVPADLRSSEDVLRVNFGPNHPSTHGVLRLIVDLHGEEVLGLAAVVGYLHTGFEKSMEQKSWWKAITYAPRIDYLAFQNNELVFVLAVEKMLGLEVPARAAWMRMLLAELNRIHSHLVWLGTAALELGAISMFWYCFREREKILDLFEYSSGQRMHTRYIQVGGVMEDLPPGFEAKLREFIKDMPKRADQYADLLEKNEIVLERLRGVGVVDEQTLLGLGVTGPLLRATGNPWDLRKAIPYSSYEDFDFRIPVGTVGDNYDRYRVRLAEMVESVRIIDQ
ncbi:MAG: NADH-quinone oxidoreductase subunit D, partial [Gaiellaceae bacterium]